MKLQPLSISLLCLILVPSAWSYELKGLKTGARIEEVKKRLPNLKCEENGWGPFAANLCIATAPTNDLSTLGDQKVNDIRFLTDKNDVIHSVSISVLCGISTESYTRSFVQKFGMPTKVNPLLQNVVQNVEWIDKQGKLILQKANGKDGVCHMVSLMDNDFIADLDKSTKPRPSKDF